jgi:hypothetical protein
MKLFKNIFLVIFAIITILFTVGYASQPIVSDSATSENGSVNTIVYTYQNIDYTNISNDKKLILQTVFYLCIAITILLTLSIIIALFGLKFISKILFFVILLLMIVVFLIIQFAIVADSLTNMAKTRSFNTPTTSNGTGYYLILVSTILMFANYILYMFLA